jgi:hypothetical protein
LAEVAGSLARAGELDRAAGLAAQAAQIATGIGNPQTRAWALGDVAGSLAQVGLANPAIDAADHIEDPKERVQVLATVARSGGADGGGDTICNAVCEVLLSPYARAHLAAVPVAVIERLLAEERLK